MTERVARFDAARFALARTPPATRARRPARAAR
jgi:hypothetical protein